MKNKLQEIAPKGATHVRIVDKNGKKSVQTIEDSETAFAGIEGKITFLAKTGKKATDYQPFAADPIDNPFAKPEPKAEVKAPEPTPAPATVEAAAPTAPVAAPEPAKAESAPVASKAEEPGEPIKAEALKVAEPAAAAPEKGKAKAKGSKNKPPTPKPAKEKKADKDVKFNFIVSLMDGTHTARAIAIKLMNKFPVEKLQVGKKITRTEALSSWEEPKGGEEANIFLKAFNKALAYVRSSRYHMKRRKIAGSYAKATAGTKKPAKTPATPTKSKAKAKTKTAKAKNGGKKDKKSAPAAASEPTPAPAGTPTTQVCNMNSGEVETVEAPPTVIVNEPVAAK